MVERFKQEISGRHDEHSPDHAADADDEPRHLPHGWRIVAGIVVLAVGYGVYHLLSAGSAPQTVPPAPSLAPPKVAVAAPKPRDAARTGRACPANRRAQRLPCQYRRQPHRRRRADNAGRAAFRNAQPRRCPAAAPPPPRKPATVYGKQ